MPRLFVFGLGYTATALARAVLADGWTVAGTCRSPEKAAALRTAGIEPFLFESGAPLDPTSLAGATHLLASIPPDPDDPALRHHTRDIAAGPALQWIGYLSTTSVYGTTDGSRVDEDTPCAPTSARGRRRLEAEQAWHALPLPAHIFRLSGIYGPGRSVFDTIRAGRAQRIVKPGQAFNRIHVADIVQTLRASMARPAPGRIYALVDDLPSPSADLVTYASGLMGVPPPPAIPFDQAVLSPMAREFWADNKRIANDRIKQELGIRLAYPTWREGLDTIGTLEKNTAGQYLSRDDEFEWDDDKAARNWRKHAVTFEMARDAFQDIFAFDWTDRDHGDTEERFGLLGMVENRLLTVSYTMRGEKIRIISARLAQPHERRRYYNANKT